MTKTALMLLLLFAAQSETTDVSRTPQGFTNVEGANLKSRLGAAIKLGAARQGRFWVAYTFAVRPGVAFDVEMIGSRGSAIVVNGARAGSQLETRNLGVFVLHEGSGGSVLRAEIYNLNRPRDYAGYPVYWIGQGPGNESLPLLRELLDRSGSSDTIRLLVDAIGAHDESPVAATLRDIIRNPRLEPARTAAISWLGYLPDQTEFLTALVRDERETIRIRREAAEALGDSPDREALPAMQTLYRAVTPREVKQELIEAIGDSTFEATAISFMMDIAENEPLRELRHEAIEQLSDMPAERAVPALVQLYDKARDEETKEEILEGLGDANVEPAWRKLAAVAQREPSLKLRKLAIELLGESEDPDAVKFLEQLIR